MFQISNASCSHSLCRSLVQWPPHYSLGRYPRHYSHTVYAVAICPYNIKSLLWMVCCIEESLPLTGFRRTVVCRSSIKQHTLAIQNVLASSLTSRHCFSDRDYTDFGSEQRSELDPNVDPNGSESDMVRIRSDPKIRTAYVCDSVLKISEF